MISRGIKVLAAFIAVIVAGNVFLVPLLSADNQSETLQLAEDAPDTPLLGDELERQPRSIGGYLAYARALANRNSARGMMSSMVRSVKQSNTLAGSGMVAQAVEAVTVVTNMLSGGWLAGSDADPHANVPEDLNIEILFDR